MGPLAARTRRAARAAALLLCLLPAPGLARPKTDVVVLRNGDQLHGEIHSLKYGKLHLKTDSMGSVYIEWPDVVALRSPHLFTIEGAGGSVFVGSLTPAADSSRVFIAGPNGASELALTRFAAFDQLETGFWKRVNGSVSLGFDYEKSTDIALLRSRLDSQYRNPTMLTSLGATADVSRAPEQETKESYSVRSSLRLLGRKARFWIGGASWERNEELGIASRVQLVVGPGRYLYRSLESEVSSFVGISANQEWAAGSGDPTLSAEAAVGGDWRTFRFRAPETSLVTSILLLPSLTETDRVRMEYNITLKCEVISDFTIDLTYYADVDSRPPADAEKLDTGIGLSFGYTF